MFRNLFVIALIIACANALSVSSVRKTIDGASKENFSAVTAEVEPFLLNDAGVTFYSKSLRRLNTKAKAFGLELPENYAKAAKCTEARRAKQDAFVKAKIEEAAEAAAEAAEEEAPAEE